jgi:uncharacterized iron-regulated membrane protein
VVRRIHLLAGLLAGLHLTVLSVTGGVLVYRAELQRALHPHLFTASAPGPRADPVAVLESVAEAYPGGRVSGVDAPTRSRETYLAYVVEEGGFRTVLVNPVTARPLGELPERSPVRLLQDLHFELFSGRTGRRVNGLGALVLLVLMATGVALWRSSRGWSGERSQRQTLRMIHAVVGMGSLALLGMWALTGVYLAFPSEIRTVIGVISPTAPPPPPRVAPTVPKGAPDPDGAGPVGVAGDAEGASPERADLGTLVGIAQAEAAAKHVARVVLPVGEGSPLLVQFSGTFPRVGSDPGLTDVYLDPGSGEVLEVRGPRAASRGHALIRWIRPLHAGDVGHPFLKILWFLGALAPPLLFATGFRLWWLRGTRG